MNNLLIILAILLPNGQSIDYAENRQEKLFLDQFQTMVRKKEAEISQPLHGYFRCRSENIYRYYDVNRGKNAVVIFTEFEICENCFYFPEHYLVVPNEQAKGKVIVYEGECASIIVNPLVSDRPINMRVEHTYYSKDDLKEFEQNLRKLTKSRFGW